METLKQTISNYEKIIADNLQVSNPVLLKTGILGTMVNIFANLKYDAAIYFTKLMNEINPATATDFSSMLFHSSILNQTIDFAYPATFDITFIVPDINVYDNQLITYTIQRNTKITDIYGFKYTLENDVFIYISGSGVQGRIYTNDGLKILKVDKVINPNDTTSFIYLVTYDGLKQFDRNIYSLDVPEYIIGETITYTLPVVKENIYKIRAWYKPVIETEENKESIDIVLLELYNHDSEEFSRKFGLNDLNLKYSKHLSSQYDNDIFLNIKDEILEFKLGDGYNGQKRNAGEKIYIEILTTNGEEANINSTEWTINKVLVQTESDVRVSNTSLSLKAVSLNGGEGGVSFQSIEEIRKSLLRKSRSRGSLITPKDFEVEYDIDNGEPFIDSKYLYGKSNVFIYNIMRDFNKKILPTTTVNKLESDFDKELFFPTMTYNNEELISPFLYKKRSNQYDAYLIDPLIKISLISNASNKITKVSNMINVYITYDFVLQKSKIVLENFNENYTYVFSCNLFSMTLNKDNGFQQEISTLFTDNYCLIDEELTLVNGYYKGLTDIKIDILNQYLLDAEVSSLDTITWDKVYVMNWFSQEQYHQTKLKQSHFLYIDIDHYNSDVEIRWVLNIPYIQKSFVTTNLGYKVFSKLDSFFKVIENKDKFPFNLEVTQALYNTIALDPKYTNYLIDINNNALDLVPKLQPIINVIIDKIKFNLSEYKTVEEFENEFKLELMQEFTKFERFKIEFFESTIESFCLQKFSIIKNIELINPKSLTSKKNTTMYYDMENDLGTLLTIKDLVDFVPPYFHFDYDNMYIKIILD
jgi:hypothetical protein